MNRSTLAVVLLAGTALVGVAAPAMAQIEEIVVTTRKRAENLQDVPITITAFTAANIERKGIATLEDITKYSPGLSLEEGFSKQDTRITIRGLSPTRGRQNAAVLIDDVDISSEAIQTAGGSLFINPRLFDVERIEVVKGPHSALYGRSAFAGAINYITKKPGDAFEGTIAADIASYGKQEGRIALSGPIVQDRLSVGFSGAAWNFNGFYRNTITGKKVGGYDGGGAAVSAVFTPNDILKFTARGEYSKDHFDVMARTFLPPSATTLSLPASAVGQGLPNIVAGTTTTVIPITGLIPDADRLPPVRQSTNPRTPGQDYPGDDRTLRSITLRSEANFERFSIISLSYIGNHDMVQFHDTLGQGDAAQLNAIQETHFLTNNKTVSEDLRIQSNDPESRLKWTVGGLFWNEITHQESRSNVCASTVGGCVTLLSGLGVSRGYFINPNKYKRATHHYSVYGIASYDVTDQLTLEAEFRNVWEIERISAGISSTSIGCVGLQRVVVAGVLRCTVPAPQVQSPTVTAYGRTRTDSEFFAPRLSVQYKLNPELMMYASAAQGKKPGGSLSLLAPTLVAGVVNFDQTKFKQESLWVYELGFKSQWLDNRLRVNANAYYQDFRNKQETGTRVDAQGLPVPGPGNAEKARVWGIEAETAFVATENLSFAGAYTYINSKYVRFNLQQNTAANIALAGNCVVVRPAVGTPYCNVSYAGKELVLSPKHSFNVSAEWRDELTADLDWFFEVDTKYMGKRFTSFDNATFLDSYWNVDLRLGVDTDKWQLVGYVTNLFDDDTLKAGVTNLPDFNTGFISGGVSPQGPGLASGTLATLPDKRQFGVRASYRF
jgi:outer membrane receptor protein involved in Fe transport